LDQPLHFGENRLMDHGSLSCPKISYEDRSPKLDTHPERLQRKDDLTDELQGRCESFLLLARLPQR
jgi:hypothetical protein